MAKISSVVFFAGLFVILPFAIQAQDSLSQEAKFYDPVSGKFITQDELNTQQSRELLLQVDVKNLILGEMVVQEIGDEIWAPFEEVIRVLDFPITVSRVDNDKLEAKGWYIKETNLFSLRALQNEPSSSIDDKYQNGKSSYQIITNKLKSSVTGSKKINNDLYFKVAEILSWFGIESTADTSLLKLSLLPSERLPIQDKKLRQQRESVSLVSNFDAQYPREDIAYKAFSPILTDIQLTARREADENSSLSASVLGSGDLAYMTGRYYLNQRYNERTESSDINASLFLERNSMESNLLGPLNATHFSFGDNRNASIANLSSSSTFGFRASNRPYGRITNSSTTDIRGLQQPGWDVELYLNGIFIDSQTIGDDGQYNFLQQPLQIGENLFTIRLYGPQGQREELEEIYVLDPAAAVGGKLIYDASIGKQNFQFSDFFEPEQATDDNYYRVNLHLEKGVNQNLSLTGDYSQYHFADGELHSFIQPGVRLFWGQTLISLNHLQDLSAGSQSSLSISRNLGMGGRHVLNYSFQSQTEDFATDSNFTSRVRLSHAIGINGRFSGFDLNYNLGAGLSEFYDDSKTENFFLNLGKSFGMLSLNNNLNFATSHQSNNGSSSSVTGRLNAAIKWQRVFFRGGLDYSLEPVNQTNTGFLEAQWNINNNLKAKLRHSYNALTDQSSQGLTVNWRNPKFVTSFVFDQADDNWRGQINLQFSLGHNPITNETFMTGSRLSNSGVVAAQVFEDLNNNQKLDENEPLIENAEVVAVQQHRRAKTNDKGVALLTELRPTQVTDIEVDSDTLDDPFWITSKEGISFLPRPGLVKTLLIPVVTAGEVEGTVSYAKDLFNSPYEQGRVPLIMTNTDNGKVIKTESSFDGFFLFTRVPPGSYTLSVEPEFLKNKSIETRSPMALKIGHKGSLILGANFTLHPEGKFDYLAEQSNDEGIAYNIDLGEFLSENNARTVLDALRNVFPKTLATLTNHASYEMLMVKKADAQYQLILGPFYDLNDVKYICGSLATENLTCSPQKVTVASADTSVKNNIGVQASEANDLIEESGVNPTVSSTRSNEIDLTEFTMQVMNTSNSFGLENFIEENQLKNVRILEVEQKGETRFILTVGSFANREQAKAAAIKYESEFDVKPWVRTFESIKYKNVIR